MFKRNDKVMIFSKYTSHPKMSMSIKVPVGRRLIIKQIVEPDSFNEGTWMICDPGPMPGFTNNWFLPIPAEKLYPYTRIGELLYG